MLLLNLPERVVVYLRQFELNRLQTTSDSSQIADKLFAYRFSYLHGISLIYDLWTLQDHVDRLLYVVQVSIDLIAFITPQRTDAVSENLLIFL